MLVNQKVKKFTELLPCTFAVDDYKQLEDVSSIENVHMVAEILSQVFIRHVMLPFPSLSSIVPHAFDALELKGPLYRTSYLIFTCRSFSIQYLHAAHQ